MGASLFKNNLYIVNVKLYDILAVICVQSFEKFREMSHFNILNAIK